MRTYDDVKKGLLLEKKSLMNRCIQALEKGGVKDFEVVALNSVIGDCQEYIDNIDEVTTIEIGGTTNSIISGIQSAYKLYLNDYWQNFEKFADEYIIGLTPEGNFKNGSFFAQSQCYQLGIGISELASCFKGKDPMSNEAADDLKKLVNYSYGTNIPMAGVEQQALQEYQSVAFSFDQAAKDKAFVNLKEVQRDAGSLKNGGTFYLLATNQDYQEAKARLEQKNL